VINPPYPFPYEDNLAFTDFVHLHAEAADYINHWYPNAHVTTLWPLTQELSRPELGYIDRQMQVTPLADLSEPTLAAVDWRKVQVLVTFSQTWDPPLSPLRLPPIRRFWVRFFHYVPGDSQAEARRRIRLPLDNSFTHRGQWLDIFVNPAVPKAQPALGLRAMN